MNWHHDHKIYFLARKYSILLVYNNKKNPVKTADV